MTVYVLVRTIPAEYAHNVWAVFASRDLAEREVKELGESPDPNVRLRPGEEIDIEEFEVIE